MDRPFLAPIKLRSRRNSGKDSLCKNRTQGARPLGPPLGSTGARPASALVPPWFNHGSTMVPPWFHHGSALAPFLRISGMIVSLCVAFLYFASFLWFCFVWLGFTWLVLLSRRSNCVRGETRVRIRFVETRSKAQSVWGPPRAYPGCNLVPEWLRHGSATVPA